MIAPRSAATRPRTCARRDGTGFHPSGPSAGRRVAAVGGGPTRSASRPTRLVGVASGGSAPPARAFGSPGDPHVSPLVPVTRTVGGDLGSQPTDPPLVPPAGTSGENLGPDGNERREPPPRRQRVARTSACWGPSARTLALWERVRGDPGRGNGRRADLPSGDRDRSGTRARTPARHTTTACPPQERALVPAQRAGRLTGGRAVHGRRTARVTTCRGVMLGRLFIPAERGPRSAPPRISRQSFPRRGRLAGWSADSRGTRHSPGRRERLASHAGP
jgi:hypothetical protein